MNRRRHARKRYAKVTGEFDEDEASLKRSIDRVCPKLKDSDMQTVTLPDGTTFQMVSVRVVARHRKLKVRWTEESAQALEGWYGQATQAT